MFKNLIPKIFYDRLQDGLEFFVDGLGFEVLFRDAGMAVMARDGAREFAMLDKTTVCVIFREWPANG